MSEFFPRSFRIQSGQPLPPGATLLSVTRVKRSWNRTADGGSHHESSSCRQVAGANAGSGDDCRVGLAWLGGMTARGAADAPQTTGMADPMALVNAYDQFAAGAGPRA